METVYYDTADLRLARWGVSLRRRAGEGWTLKLAQPPSTPGKPGAVLERDELTFQGGAAKPPEAALEVVRAYVRKAELVPVARLSTVRRRVRLVDATGTRVAEVVDDEVSVRDGRRVAARFREIEVEVLSTNGVDGSDSADGILTPLVTRLRGAGAGVPDPTPKHIRALGPRAIEPPEVSAQPLPPDARAKDVIRNAIAESVAALLHHDPLVRTGRDPEAIHQARVATRKLRSNLRTFGPLLDPEWTEPLRSAVRGLRETPTDPELHRIRIRARRARCAAEAVAPGAGPAASAFARAAAKLQTILGEHQDSVTAQAWLRSAKASGKRAFVAGELIALEGLAANEARSKWRKVWNSLDRKRLRVWMP